MDNETTQAPPIAAWLQALDFGAELEAAEERHHRELERLLVSLLEVVDSFDRVLAAPAGGGMRSLRLIARQLERVLADAGVRPAGCLGEVVDPERHEIADTRDTGETADDVIVGVVRRGWDWRERPLRRPRVVVAKNPDPGSPRAPRRTRRTR